MGFSDSASKRKTIARAATAWRRVVDLPLSTTKTIATTIPHTTEGARSNERREKQPIPRMLPRMSYRYASSASNWMNVRATPSAIIAIAAATATKTIGSESHVGSPCDGPEPKKISCAPVRTMRAGKARTKMTRSAKASGAHLNRLI